MIVTCVGHQGWWAEDPGFLCYQNTCSSNYLDVFIFTLWSTSPQVLYHLKTPLPQYCQMYPIEMKVPWKNSVEHFLPAALWNRGKKVWLLVHFSDEINSNMNALYQGLFWLSVFQDPFNLCQLLYRIGNVTPQIFSTVFWLSYYMLFPFHFSIRSLTWPLQGYSVPTSSYLILPM